MSLTLFTNWAVGVMYGYMQKENGLPNSIKYCTIGITTFIGVFKTLGNWDTPTAKNLISTITPRQKLAGLLIGAPLIMSANFCVGHHMGKAIRFVEDTPKHSTDTLN